MKQTSNKASEPENQTSRTAYQKAMFGIAFALIFLESAFLLFAPSLESVVPFLTQEIIDNRAQLLAVAAAITMILALLTAWDPKGMPQFAALGSGVLSFSAASVSIEMEQLSTGIALLAIVFPYCITMLPSIKWPESKSDWLPLIMFTSFIILANEVVILGITPITEIAVLSGINTFPRIVMISLLIAILDIAGIIVLQLFAKFLIQTNIVSRFYSYAKEILGNRQLKSRAARRREKRNNRDN